MNVDKALAKGLKIRPLQETILDVFNWREQQDFAMKAGISGEKERKLLNKLRNQT